ncbi:MAG: serine/threonine-protein kinase HipA [Alteromonadaceae bacterium]|jgi:serine/threonine-protein kinase HipA
MTSNVTAKPITEAYVFIDGLEDQPLICGQFRLDTSKGKGTFIYGKSHLS